VVVRLGAELFVVVVRRVKDWPSGLRVVYKGSATCGTSSWLSVSACALYLCVLRGVSSGNDNLCVI
jgi:hypothetical protein